MNLSKAALLLEVGAEAHYWLVHTCVIYSLCYADPVAEHYLRSQTKYANGASSPHISPCDSAYDRVKEDVPKQDGPGAAQASGLERACSARDEVATFKGNKSIIHLLSVVE